MKSVVVLMRVNLIKRWSSAMIENCTWVKNLSVSAVWFVNFVWSKFVFIPIIRKWSGHAHFNIGDSRWGLHFLFRLMNRKWNDNDSVQFQYRFPSAFNQVSYLYIKKKNFEPLSLACVFDYSEVPALLAVLSFFLSFFYFWRKWISDLFLPVYGKCNQGQIDSEPEPIAARMGPVPASLPKVSFFQDFEASKKNFQPESSLVRWGSSLVYKGTAGKNGTSHSAEACKWRAQPTLMGK